jgi:protein SCO1/2
MVAARRQVGPARRAPAGTRHVDCTWRRLGLALVLAFGAACKDAQELPSYGPLPEFSLKDQRGQTVTQRDLQGKVVVVDFIFTSCPDVCPLLTEQLAALRKQIPDAAPLQLVSFSVDPEHDTPERLQQFAAAHGADLRDWSFLTGSLDDVKRVVSSGFKQAMEAEPDRPGKPRNVLHGTHFVLVDQSGQIRGFFASGDADARTALRAGVLTLLGHTS